MQMQAWLHWSDMWNRLVDANWLKGLTYMTSEPLQIVFLNFISKIFFDSTATSERHKCNEVTLIVLQQYHSALDCKMAITKTQTTVMDTFSVQMASCTKRTAQLGWGIITSSSSVICQLMFHVMKASKSDWFRKLSMTWVVFRYCIDNIMECFYYFYLRGCSSRGANHFGNRW